MVSQLQRRNEKKSYAITADIVATCVGALFLTLPLAAAHGEKSPNQRARV